MKPIVQELVDGYLLKWEAEEVAINVNRIRSHSDGSVKAEIVVQTTKNGFHPHLHQSMLNLLADRSRVSLANTLKTKYPKADWPTMLEQMCVLVLARIRRGEEMEELLTSADDVVPPEYVMKPFLVKHFPTIIFGDRSSAKSLTAAIMSTILLLPWADNPLRWQAPGRSIKSLWLDWETDRNTVLWQLTRVQIGMALPPLAVQYRRMSATLSHDVDQVQKYITESNAEVLVIDSLSLACAGELKESGPAAMFWQAMRKLKTSKGEAITSLILAHTSKEQGIKKTVVGSFMFEAQARVIWEARKSEQDEDSIDVALFHRKPPPFDRIHKPLGYKATFTESTIAVTPENPKDVKAFSDALSLQEQITDALKGGSMSMDELSEALGAKVGSIKTKLYQWRGKKFIQTEGGKWGLVYHQ